MRLVFERHEPRLRSFALRVLGNPQDAEEVAVATFLRFWQSAGRYRGDCSLKSFLTRIALNLARDRMRKAPCPEFVPTPLRPSYDEEAFEQIRLGLLQLAPEDRELLALYYLQDMSYEELSDSIGISYDVLRTRLVRARKRLRIAVGASDE